MLALLALCGMQSPSDSDFVGPMWDVRPPDPVAEGPVGPGGTMSSPDPAGILWHLRYKFYG